MAKVEKPNRLWMTVLLLVAAPCVVLGICGYIFISGYDGWSKGGADRAAVGEAFGMASAVFTGFALIAAAWAVYLQSAAMTRERAASDAQAVEARFFQMLGNLQTAVNETRTEHAVGRQAMRKILEWLTLNLKPCRNYAPGVTDEERFENIRQWFQHFYDGTACATGLNPPVPAVDLLGHIFRLIYHILKYVNASDAIGREEKEAYAGILRAHLSNSELVMLFYNSMTIHGFKNHFPLLVGYTMFKNMNHRALAQPQEDWALFLKKVEERSADVEAKVGHKPSPQGPQDMTLATG